MRPIAHIHSDFATKFGIPRQSGVVGSLQAEIIFEPEFRSRDAVRGLEAFSHIWLIWEFSENVRADWSPTVRPPRLGGNVRMGVFATRSPFRPNPIGLSCVRLEDITFSDARGPVLHVAGADLMDGTPIYERQDVAERFALIIGNEGNGVSEQVQQTATHRVRLPMRGGAESLNAAIAAAIMMYELMR